MTDLVFDVESTGLLRKDAPLTDAAQPHITQLGAHLYDEDRKLRGSMVTLIKPLGWVIEDQAEEKTGISTRQCAQFGIELVVALAMFKEMALKVTGNIVAHNATFDRRMIHLSLMRVGALGAWWGNVATKVYCTMEELKDVLRLPGNYGDWKYPSLDEAHAFFVPDDITGMRARRKISHDAETDVFMTAQVFWGLQTRASHDKR